MNIPTSFLTNREGFTNKGFLWLVGNIILIYAIFVVIVGLLAMNLLGLLFGIGLVVVARYISNSAVRKRNRKALLIEQKLKDKVLFITEAELENTRNKFDKGYLAVTSNNVAFLNYSNNDVYSINQWDISNFGSQARKTGDTITTVGHTKTQSIGTTHNVTEPVFYISGSTNGQKFSYIWRCSQRTKVYNALEKTSIMKQMFPAEQSNSVDNVMNNHRL